MALTVNGIEVIHSPSPAVGRPGDCYEGFKRESIVLQPGHQKTPNSRAFSQETVFDRDIEVPLRDGTRLRADVFRANNEQKVPALVAWSPYGKGGSGFFNLRIAPARAGVPDAKLSGYEKFEAPDPAEWVPRGYAIVNIDSRGAFDSEGDVRMFGSAEGRDGYDAIEYIAQLPWCSGAIALVGNSWLAIAQYFIASEQPPHLACIAPLEGCTDLYREQICRGGVPNTVFWNAVQYGLSGRNQMEDAASMLEKYALMNDYWDDKRAKIEKIKVPAYILASYSTGLHTEGSFRCFEEMKAPRWLAVHATQEWYDLYSDERTEDLQRFFDRYLKDIDNGWESTAPVRGCLLGFNKPPITDLKLPDWPPPNTSYKCVYLADSQKLSSQLPITSQQASYQSDAPAQQMDDDNEELHFSFSFNEKTYMLGYSKVVLYVSCADHNDLDVFVQLRKADKDDNILRHLNMPLDALGANNQDEVPTLNIAQYLGPTGMIRASRREVDPTISKSYHQSLSLLNEEKIAPGTVVRLEIPIWPSGIIFEPGEKLVLKVSGHPMVLAEFPQLRGQYAPANRGKHVVHFGGENESFVELPFISL